jgi:hypothetical protein
MRMVLKKLEALEQWSSSRQQLMTPFSKLHVSNAIPELEQKQKDVLGRGNLLRDRHPTGPLGWRIISSHRCSSKSISLILWHLAKHFQYAAEYYFWMYQIELTPRPTVRRKFDLSCQLCSMVALVWPPVSGARTLPPLNMWRSSLK